MRVELNKNSLAHFDTTDVMVSEMRLVYFLEWHYGPGNYLIVFPFPYSVIVPCTMRAWCMTTLTGTLTYLFKNN